MCGIVVSKTQDPIPNAACPGTKDWRQAFAAAVKRVDCSWAIEIFSTPCRCWQERLTGLAFAHPASHVRPQLFTEVQAIWVAQGRVYIWTKDTAYSFVDHDGEGVISVPRIPPADAIFFT